MYKGKTIGVVTAAYNEEAFIAEVVRTMPPLVDRIYVTNDASTDRTGAILAGIGDKRLVVTNHQSRSGAGAATLTGYKRARQENMEVVAVMAGDGQMDPAILWRILDPVVEGRAEYSKGNRLSSGRDRKGMPSWRLLGNSILNYVIKATSGYWSVDDPLNGYTAISREALVKLDLDHIEKDYSFETDLLVKLNVAGARVVNVVMPSRYGNEKSKIVYFTFIVRISGVIVRDFVWRIWNKRVKALFGTGGGKGRSLREFDQVTRP